METTPCTKCGHPTIGSRRWERLPKPRPARRRYSGGVCRNCYNRDRHAPKPRHGVSADLQVLDWHWLHETGQLSPTDSVAERLRVAAPRIGTTPTALEQVLRRRGLIYTGEVAA